MSRFFRRPFVLKALLLAIALTMWSQNSSMPEPSVEPRNEGSARARKKRARVILLTLDGPVRDDIFSTERMPQLHATLKTRGVLLKARAASSMAMSLPGYQALAAGHATSCHDNECSRITDETLLEFLARSLVVPAEQVAVFASWSRLKRAVTSKDGAVFVDAPDDGLPQVGGPRWKNARFDSTTFDAAVAHWNQQKPRFLQISLLDTDEWAHAGFREEYEAALLAADAQIAHLLALVDALPDEERSLTTVLITSDHGRGHSNWREHGFFELGSRDIFLAAFGETVLHSAFDEKEVLQVDVRPTIERLFGFCTNERRVGGGGRPIEAITRDVACE
jgi:predicted AlkP superfamily pyrophosphatase or phosphodiesterase